MLTEKTSVRIATRKRMSKGWGLLKNYMDKYVSCPFYSSESGSKIRCEGFSRTNSIQTSFVTKEHLAAHKIRFCKHITKHKDCPLYTIINKKYEEGGS